MKKLINRLRNFILRIKILFFRCMGMDIDKRAKISNKAKLDFTFPKGIHVGKFSYIGGGTLVLSHDYCRKIHTDTWIGDYCFIGMESVILPGIRIGNHCIIGAGSVVTKDVPNNTIVAGNPAKTIREGILTGKYGQLIDK